MRIPDVGLLPVSFPACSVVVASRWIGWTALTAVQPDGAHLGGAVALAGRSVLADGRHFQSVRASAARLAPSTLPPRSRRSRHRTPHHRSPPTAPQAVQTSATASPSPPENSADCHCPAPDSSDGNTKSRSETARAASAPDRAFSSATSPAATPQTAPAPAHVAPPPGSQPSTTCARSSASDPRSTFDNFRNASIIILLIAQRDARTSSETYDITVKSILIWLRL